MKSTRMAPDTSLKIVGSDLLFWACSPPTPSQKPVKEPVLHIWAEDIKVEIIFPSATAEQPCQAAWKQINTAFPQKSP